MSYGQNAPVGLQPRTYLTGAPWSQQNRTYRINNTVNLAPIFLGDPVKLQGDGTIIAAPTGDPGPWVGVFQGVQYYNPNNGNQFQSAKYWPGGIITQPPGFYPMALVADDPTIIFSIQASTSVTAGGPPGVGTATGVAMDQLFMNATAAFNATGNAAAPPAPPYIFAPYNASATTTVQPLPNPVTGNIPGGQSAFYLDVSTIADTATLPLKILDLESSVIPTQAFYSANGVILTGVFNNVLVLINNHYYKGGTGTLGV
jgi:hypothetical protein